MKSKDGAKSFRKGFAEERKKEEKRGRRGGKKKVKKASLVACK